MIDEFQDTSDLQWKNLIPLISHALESKPENEDEGSLFLVGDPKQSVYRWRGADPKIFASLLLLKTIRLAWISQTKHFQKTIEVIKKL